MGQILISVSLQVVNIIQPGNSEFYSILCHIFADHSDRAVYGGGLGLLACWVCVFESRWSNECLSVVSVVCYQV
jgi:hypothetical protein